MWHHPWRRPQPAPPAGNPLCDEAVYRPRLTPESVPGVGFGGGTLYFPASFDEALAAKGLQGFWIRGLKMLRRRSSGLGELATLCDGPRAWTGAQIAQRPFSRPHAFLITPEPPPLASCVIGSRPGECAELGEGVASGSSGPYSCVASHGASCFRYFALKQCALQRLARAQHRAVLKQLPGTPDLIAGQSAPSGTTVMTTLAPSVIPI
jgi:hypothetical protein